MSQSHGTNLWQEPAGSGATPTLTQYVLKKVDGAWQHVAGSVPDGIAVDPGDGTATIFDLTQEYFAVSDSAGGFVLSLVGPAAAVLVDDGNSGLTLTPVGAGVVQAGRFFPDSNGEVYPIRFDADEMEFVLVRGVTQSY